MRRENCAPEKRPKNFRKQQIGNRAQQISSSRMTRHVNPKPAQLLNQPPNFRPAGRDFLSDLSSANHQGSVLHQQANNNSQPQVSRQVLMRRKPVWNKLVWRGHSCPRGFACCGYPCPRIPALPICPSLCDAEIIRESPRNNNVGNNNAETKPALSKAEGLGR